MFEFKTLILSHFTDVKMLLACYMNSVLHVIIDSHIYDFIK